MTELRRYTMEDLEALYAISLATGLAGGDASHLYTDRRLIGHIYSAPYAVLEPDMTLLLADAEGVGGFIVGVTNTEAWEDRLERDWWPTLRVHYESPVHLDRTDWTADQARIARIFRPERTPKEVVEKYPAHLHMNILPRLQRRGLGSKLLGRWSELAIERGVNAVHVGVNDGNHGALCFWRKQGFVQLKTSKLRNKTVWMGRKFR